jgi:predicted nicotinamide N-methyase
MNNEELIINEDKKFGYAGEIWKCARVLSDFICSDKIKKLFKNKTVLEIGSGTGYCGLTAALLGTRSVYLTDREENLEIIEKNYNYNRDRLSSIIITPLNWNNIVDYKNIRENIDIIIASDIIYHGVNSTNIIKTFDYFSNMTTDIILAYNIRLDVDFFDKLSESNKWSIKRFPDDLYSSDNGVVLFYIKKIS